MIHVVIFILLCLLDLIHSFVGIAIDGYGNGTIGRTIDGGNTWQVLFTNSTNLYGLKLINNTNVVAVGDNNTVIINEYINSNTTLWTSPYSTFVAQQIPSATNIDLHEASVSGTGIIVAVGTSSTIELSTDTGYSFISIRLNNTMTQDINSATFNGNIGFGVGNVNLLIRSIDSGYTWSLININTSTINNYYAVDMYDENTIVAVGNQGSIIQSSDGGATWIAYKLPGVTSSLLDVAYVSNNTILVCGSNHVLYRSTDNGVTWTIPIITPDIQSTEPIASITFADNNSLLGIAASRNTLMLTRDGGSSFTVLPKTSIFNYISNVAIISTSLVTSYPPITAIQLYNGTSAFKSSIQLSNLGTEQLIINNYYFSDPNLSIDTGCIFPTTIDANNNATLCLSYNSVGVPSGRIISYLILYTNSLTQQSNLTIYTYIYSAPVIINSSWISNYWYVIVLPFAVIGIIIYFVARRRMNHIKQYNRRIADRAHHITFWDFALCHRIRGISNGVVEHDPDSDFWSDYSSSDEESDDEYTDSDSNSDSYSDSDYSSSGSDSTSNKSMNKSNNKSTHSGKRLKQRQSSQSSNLRSRLRRKSSVSSVNRESSN